MYDGKAGPENVALSYVEIPEYLTTSSNKNLFERESTSKSTIYDMVKFSNVIPIRSDSISIPITIYGTEYIADL